jgi:ornithine carbamoyltransferase
LPREAEQTGQSNPVKGWKDVTMKRDFLSIWDLSQDELQALIQKAITMKAQWAEGRLSRSMTGKVLGLLFVKPSTRTRVSFEAAMYRMGGNCLFLTSHDTQLSRSEPLSDTARVLSRYIDALVVRTYAHDDVIQLGQWASIPIINGLTDLLHPCQVMSDLLTLAEMRGHLDDLKVAWVGDGNNMAHSWLHAAGRLGFTLYISCPDGYWPDARLVHKVQREGAGTIVLCDRPRDAVKEADAINTDVWTSMGQESEAASRREVFKPFQVNMELLRAAPEHAVVLHCLPAHRGEEITDEVIEGPQSVVFDQAENRLHFQAALLDRLINHTL